MLSSTFHKIYKGEMTSIHTPITLQHKPIICTNEILFIYNPLYLFNNYGYMYYLKMVLLDQNML